MSEKIAKFHGEMFKSLKALNEVISAAKKEVQAKGQAAIKEAFMELFAAHPELKGVEWTQYTPYFNDGDTCTFGLHDHYVSAEWTEAEDVDYEYNGMPFEYPSTWNITDAEEKTKKDTLYRAVNALFALLEDEAMEAAFGDYVRVVATREGFDVSEYDHD